MCAHIYIFQYEKVYTDLQTISVLQAHNATGKRSIIVCSYLILPQFLLYQFYGINI